METKETAKYKVGDLIYSKVLGKSWKKYPLLVTGFKLIKGTKIIFVYELLCLPTGQAMSFSAQNLITLDEEKEKKE